MQIKSQLSQAKLEALQEASVFEDMSQSQFDLWLDCQIKDICGTIKKNPPVPENKPTQFKPIKTQKVSKTFISYILSRQK